MSIETEVLWLDDHRVVSLHELVEISGLGEAELLELVQLGALPARDAAGGGYSFSARVVTIMQPRPVASGRPFDPPSAIGFPVTTAVVV